MTQHNPFSNPAAGEKATVPGGFNIFGPGAPSGMEAFASNIPGFPSMGKLGEPTAEDMEKGMEQVRYSKVVKVQAVHVRTFDFSNPGHVKSYEELYVDLYAKAAKKQIYIKTMDKQFVNDPTNPRWVLHLEWMEYELQVKDYMKEGADDAEDS